MKLSKKEVETLWRAGDLGWKLYPHQQEARALMWERAVAPKRRMMLLRWSRRTGKTFVEQVFCAENLIRVSKAYKRAARIVVAAPSEKHLEEFVHPTVKAIYADAPPDLQPKWVERESAYVFPEDGAAHGSRLVMAGAVNETAIDRLSRGPAADGIVYEEAGAIAALAKLRKAMGPQLMTYRGQPMCAWRMYVGTPPETMDHEFVRQCHIHQAFGLEIHRTVYQSHLTKEQIDGYISDEAGTMSVEEYKATEDFRREFLAELIADPGRKVFKHADDDTVKACVQRYLDLGGQRPSHYVAYGACDFGWDPDWTFYLLGWWHRPKQMLVVEAELFYRGPWKRDVLVADVEALERRVLGPDRCAPYLDRREPPRRAADVQHGELIDKLAAEHGLVFSKMERHDRDLAIQTVDRSIVGMGHVGTLAINPECKELQAQVKFAAWKKKGGRRDFDRPDGGKRHGHFDGAAALVGLRRQVVPDENPVPHDWGYSPTTLFYPDGAPQHTPDSEWSSLWAGMGYGGAA